MSRPWRIQFPGAIYHVASRGNNHQVIFLDSSDKQTFLDLIGLAATRFNLHIFTFCLMDNHYHLFLRTPDANLSAAMHWLNVTYTNRFHRRHGRSGHLLQVRYKSVLVTDEDHWFKLSMYIHLNPVRARMVEDPAAYEWSSFRDYTRSKSRYNWLCPQEVLSSYGTAEAEQRRRYRKDCVILGGMPSSFWEEIRSSVVLGPRELLDELKRKYRPVGNSREVRDFITACRPEIDFKAELLRIAKTFTVSTDDLMKRRRNFPARQAVYYHLVENCGLCVARVGELMGVSAMAVSLGIRRFKEKLEEDSSLKERVHYV